MRQTIRARGHVKNKWCIVSSWSQKQHFLHPCQFLRTRLSFVRITLRYRNHIKILIFSGTFIFQMNLRWEDTWPLIKSRYKDWTVNLPEGVKSQEKTSFSFDSWTSIKRESKWVHLFHLLPVNDLLKDKLTGGVMNKTEANVASFLRTILYRDGYWLASGLSPNHVSTQKRVFSPLPMWKEPQSKNSSTAFMRPLQKGESVALALAWESDLECKYFFRNSSCQTPDRKSVV